MADEQHQSGRPADKVTLPDKSSGWSISGILQKHSDPTTLNWSPEKSSLNMFFGKDEIKDVLASEAGGKDQRGGLLTGARQPDYSVGPVDIAPLPLPDRLETDQAFLKEPRVQALLATIRAHEGQQYNKLTGGGTFDDYSQHPRIVVGDSRAAGAYQLLPGTWDPIQKNLHLPDFSPASQDLAAVDLLRRRGARDKLLAGDLDGTIIAASREWMGLPSSAETMIDAKGRTRGIDASKKHAPTFTLDQIRADYWKNLR